MKHRLKQITKFIAICALVALVSCEKDLYEEGMKNENSRVSVTSLDKLPFFKE